MSEKATEEFENQLFSCVQDALAEIPDTDLDEIYAISFWVFSEDDDPRRMVLDVSYNTETQVDHSLEDASDPDEARWNFAYWLQNELIQAGVTGDTMTIRFRDNWLAEHGWDTELDDDNPEQAADLFTQIQTAFWDLAARVARRLHDSGALMSTLGRPVPMIIHDLEYYDEVVQVTRRANPPDFVEEFAAWVEGL